ncbi:MAG: energy transducer TonB [Pseudomonadota bacterium]
MWARLDMGLDTGQKISAVGHVGLLSVAVFGGTFSAEPLPFQVTEVTAISAEEYAALFEAEPSPEAVANVDTPEPPEAGQPPNVNAVEDTDIAQDTPEATEAVEPDDTPDVPDPAPPEAEVSDEPPVLQPPEEDVAVLVPEIAEESRPEAAPRVAPETIAQPDPDVQIDDVDQQATTNDDTSEQAEEAQSETAREAAAERLLTEALEDAAPARSLRPKSRPQTRPEPAETETAEPAEPAEPERDAVEDAIAAALGGTDEQAQTAPSGPPLTSGEKDALRVAVQQCWNVGSLSTDALNTTVIVGMSMSQDGRPDVGSIEMLSSSGGSGAAASQAFEAARRAIIRCGANGFPLPVEKYHQWRNIEITFNPENMRIR